MTTMTIRGIDDTLAQTLKDLARSQGVSLNSLALRLIREATGMDKRKRTMIYHDLDSLAGTWSEADEAAFKTATEPFGIIDVEMWNTAAQNSVQSYDSVMKNVKNRPPLSGDEIS